MLFKTFTFCSKVLSECGKCRFRDPKIQKSCQGVMPPDPPTEMCCHFTVRIHGPLLAWNGKALKWVPVQASRCASQSIILYLIFISLYYQSSLINCQSSLLGCRLNWTQLIELSRQHVRANSTFFSKVTKFIWLIAIGRAFLTNGMSRCQSTSVDLKWLWNEN